MSWKASRPEPGDLVPKLLPYLGVESVHPGEGRAAGRLVQGPVLSDCCGPPCDPKRVPMDIVQPVEILTVLHMPCRFSREERLQIEDGDSFRPKRALKAIEIVARPLAGGRLIDQERPVHRVFIGDEHNQQIEARLPQFVSEPPPVVELDRAPAVEVVYLVWHKQDR